MTSLTIVLMICTIYCGYKLGTNSTEIFRLQLGLRALSENYQHMTNQLYMLERTARELHDRINEDA